MFGYVLPLREELKVRDWERFHSVYCGLCHAMGRQYGPLSRFLLNYDFTFLALLLGTTRQETRCRCISGPCQGRWACNGCDALEIAADESVILAWWKLEDQVRDGKGVKQLGGRILSLLYRRAYRKAAKRRPDFDGRVCQAMDQLNELEKAQIPSLDRPADTFAGLLAAAAPESGDPVRERCMHQLLYHLGRWIYLIDAWDDLEEDLKSGGYNPFIARYSLTVKPGAEEAITAQAALTLTHSLNLAWMAAQLLELGKDEALVENILCGGLPLVQKLVFSGTWKQQKKILREYKYERSL